MGFYGTLKLIFYKVSIDYRKGLIDLDVMRAVVQVVVQHRDDEAFLTAECLGSACVCARLCITADLFNLIIDYRSPTAVSVGVCTLSFSS